MSLTLLQLQTRLNAYLEAEAAILKSQEYTVKPGDGTERRVRKADLADVRAEIANLSAQITQATPGARRVMYVS